MSAIRCVSRSFITSRASVSVNTFMAASSRASSNTTNILSVPSFSSSLSSTSTSILSPSSRLSLSLTQPQQTFNVRTFASTAGSFLDKKEVAARVMEVLKGVQKIDQSKITATAHFTKDLGLDSLDTVEVVLAFEDEFGVEIPDNEADKIHSVSDAVEYIASNPNAK